MSMYHVCHFIQCSCSKGKGSRSPDIDGDGGSKPLSVPALVQEASSSSSSSNNSCTKGFKGGGHSRSLARKASPSSTGVDQLALSGGLFLTGHVGGRHLSVSFPLA